MKPTTPLLAVLAIASSSQADLPTAGILAGLDRSGYLYTISAERGHELQRFLAFDPAFAGGVRVATGDVNGDGADDLIAGSGPGGVAKVKVFDGVSGSLIRTLDPFGGSFSGGVFVASSDTNHDGLDDIAVGADRGGLPVVELYNAFDWSIQTIVAAPISFRGGIRVACADLTGDACADVVTAPGPGGPPEVTLWDGETLEFLVSFPAYGPAYRRGLYVAVGYHEGDIFRNIIVGTGPGGPAQVKIMGVLFPTVRVINPYPPSFTGGVRVASLDLGGPSNAILTAPGPGIAPQVKVYDGGSYAFLWAKTLTSSSQTPGAYVAGIGVPDK